MNKKKVLTLVAALTLVGAVGIGATLAYFTDSDAATNVITMGHVDIDLTEPEFDKPVDDPSTPDVDESQEEKDNIIENIVPGQKIVKDPTITVAEDSEDAYIRAKLEFTGFDKFDDVEKYGEGAKAAKVQELLDNINIDDTVWYQANDVVADEDEDLVYGYFYYKDKVVAGQSVELFDKVVIPEKWGNEVADLTFEIIVSAEAIQADNTIDDPATEDVREGVIVVENGMITAWTYSDGTAVTAENYVPAE